MRDALELLADRGVDRRVGVAVDVAPQRRGAVEVGVAVGVVERAALGPLDDERVLLGPALLLGERVPQDPLVDRCQLARGHALDPRRALGRTAARAASAPARARPVRAAAQRSARARARRPAARRVSTTLPRARRRAARASMRSRTSVASSSSATNSVRKRAGARAASIAELCGQRQVRRAPSGRTARRSPPPRPPPGRGRRTARDRPRRRRRAANQPCAPAALRSSGSSSSARHGVVVLGARLAYERRPPAARDRLGIRIARHARQRTRRGPRPRVAGPALCNGGR